MTHEEKLHIDLLWYQAMEDCVKEDSVRYAFAALVRADEREACAKVCEAESELRKDAAHKTHGNGSPAYGRQMSGVNAANNCAAAIRARGQQ